MKGFTIDSMGNARRGPGVGQQSVRAQKLQPASAARERQWPPPSPIADLARSVPAALRFLHAVGFGDAVPRAEHCEMDLGTLSGLSVLELQSSLQLDKARCPPTRSHMHARTGSIA